MSKSFWAFLLVGVAAASALVGVLLYWNRGAHIELKGSIQKVRTLASDESSAVVIADFRFVNPADYPFVVRKVDVFLEDAAGQTLEGMVVSEIDAKRLFDYYPTLGQKFNPSLMVNAKIAPHASLDRMIAAQFKISEEKAQARKSLRIRVEDVDGAVSEIVEKAPSR
ncbi:MAG: hypothetical protein LLG20_17775 [Acidobacteriales bacterium]|nr:hypothetical protein [Terriglobales bacterium]